MAAIYRPLNDIIDALRLESKQDDSYLSNTPRWAIQRWARKGLQEFIEKYTSQIKSLRLIVNDAKAVDLPLDFIKLLGISQFTDCGKLIPIGQDTSIFSANSYLLDNENRILLDNKGNALLGSGDTDIQRDCSMYDHGNGAYFNNYNYNVGYYANWSSLGRYYDINPSYSRDLNYRIDVNNSIIQLSGGQIIDEVVVDYVYNPILSKSYLSELEIHRFFADALEKYVYYNIIAPKRSVIINEKERARRAYKEALIDAKLNKNAPSFQMLKYVTKLT